jgi:P27 family predicted phage terminase small subunit
MGRTADPPAVQKAKGNPGRRRSAVRKREAEIARVAELLAAAPVDPADPNAPPALIDRGPMFAAAVAVWKQLAPKLSSTHRLQPQHRPLFAMFCVYFAEWVLANEDIMQGGPTQVVQTTVGGSMERVRPIVRMRDSAFDQVLKLSDRFGLTPSDEYALFKEQQIAAALNPGLFDREPRQSAAEAKPDEAPAPTGGIIGAMKRLDSVPPGARPN